MAKAYTGKHIRNMNRDFVAEETEFAGNIGGSR